MERRNYFYRAQNATALNKNFLCVGYTTIRPALDYLYLILNFWLHTRPEHLEILMERILYADIFFMRKALCFMTIQIYFRGLRFVNNGRGGIIYDVTNIPI